MNERLVAFLQASRGQYIQHAQPASVSMQQEVQQPYISQAPGQTSQHKSQPETLIAYLQQAAASGGLVDRQQPAAQSQQHVTPLTAGQLQVMGIPSSAYLPSSPLEHVNPIYPYSG